MSASEATHSASEAHEKDEAHGEGDHGHHGPAWLAHHFDTPAQQFDAAKLGMWAFLAQELLFFSGVFVAYGIYRSWYPEMFSAAAHMLNRPLGALNTIVLLFSSLTAALAVRSSQRGDRKATSALLVVTILCACTFLVVKYFEYSHKIHAGLLPYTWYDPEKILHHEHVVLPENSHIFFGIYFSMTGLHGLHVVVGIGILLWILIRNQRGEFSKEFFTPVDISALYWHLVDLIWIYLFPLLYLID
jgi:cytochrome c oxidase subunit 3